MLENNSKPTNAVLHDITNLSDTLIESNTSLSRDLEVQQQTSIQHRGNMGDNGVANSNYCYENNIDPE